MKNPGERNTKNKEIISWVDEMTRLCQPDHVFWCDGSEEEKDVLTTEAVAKGVLIKLNQEKLPGCYYHRSNPNDVARVEECTFICTQLQEDAEPTNNCCAPVEMYRQHRALCRGCMRARTMYVVPFLLCLF